MIISQILAIVIFALMFIAIISGRVPRYIAALTGAFLTITVVFLITMQSPQAVINVLNLEQLGQFRFWIPGHEIVESQGVNWQTVIFIGGMMVMVDGMGDVGFFRWLCLYIAKLVNYRVIPILISFILVSGFLAMFIDSITVMLFLSSATIELSRILKFDPVPVIVAEIFAANTGGSATMCGDPPNIIIGTAFGYTFSDFVVNTGPIAWAGMIVAVLYFYIIFRKTLKTHSDNSDTQPDRYPEPREAIVHYSLFKVYIGIFILVVVLLVTHAQTGLSLATIGCIAAAVTLIVSARGALRILKRIHWRTLLFLIGLFICVGGLEETGVLQTLAEYIGEAAGDRIVLAIPLILWLSAFASSIIDNIPFAATMVPVISRLAQTAGFDLPTLSWALALGTDIGGNATPIGASANIIGVAIAEREGYQIGWKRFLKYALPVTIMVVLLCYLLLIVRYA